MNTKRLLVLAGVGILSTLLSAEAALANHYVPRNSSRARSEIRSDWAEIRKDRAELRRDTQEYYEDRTDLRGAIRRGASPAEIARRGAEVRQDLREIEQDRGELRRDHRELNDDTKSRLVS